MNLLNTKSILKCNEQESEIHNQEIVSLMEEILSIGDIECNVHKTYLDIAHKDTPTRVYLCSLEDLWSIIESCDCTNGCDIYIDENEFYTILIYGRYYEMNGQSHITMTALKIYI